MFRFLLPVGWSLSVIALLAAPRVALAQDAKPKGDEQKANEHNQTAPAGLAEMMEKAKKYTQPGKHHELLKRLLGKWDTELRLVMGGRKTPVEKGSSETTWLMKDRWIQTKSTGTMMGRPIESFTVLGYDNFKMSYVLTSVSSMDTAMHRAEGDLDPGGKALLVYGMIDEYLTGEHDKMVKTVIRFLSGDQYVMEIHDLPIGEKNTKVVEVTYTRKK